MGLGIHENAQEARSIAYASHFSAIWAAKKQFDFTKWEKLLIKAELKETTVMQTLSAGLEVK